MRPAVGFAVHYGCAGISLPFRGTFIEALKLRPYQTEAVEFPFLFGGTFIEAASVMAEPPKNPAFPFLFGGTFIEAAG